MKGTDVCRTLLLAARNHRPAARRRMLPVAHPSECMLVKHDDLSLNFGSALILAEQVLAEELSAHVNWTESE